MAGNSREERVLSEAALLFHKMLGIRLTDHKELYRLPAGRRDPIHPAFTGGQAVEESEWHQDGSGSSITHGLRRVSCPLGIRVPGTAHPA